MIPRFSFLYAALALASLTQAQADPLAELNAFSSIKGVNLDDLAKGSIKSGRMPAMGFARGLGVESCYVVRKPLAKTAELHEQWTPARHPELKVYLHGDLPAHPGAGDFGKLGSAPGNGAVKSFVVATLKLGSGGGKLQLSNAEAKTAPADGAGGAMPPAVASFWSSILAQRAQAYTSGGLGKLPAYETAGETVRVGDDIAQLLKEAAKVRSQFSGLIGSTPLGGGKGSPSLYWEMFDEEGHAAVCLGASYSKKADAGLQSVEVQYYASSGYYAFLTFYQMWPVSIGGQDCTLVWRGDLISASELGKLHGAERQGSGIAMIQETKKAVQAFLNDVK